QNTGNDKLRQDRDHVERALLSRIRRAAIAEAALRMQLLPESALGPGRQRNERGVGSFELVRRHNNELSMLPLLSHREGTQVLPLHGIAFAGEFHAPAKGRAAFLYVQ